MGKPEDLRILHLEDNLNDAELISEMLSSGGLACRVTLVRSREDFAKALAAGDFDLILSDYSIPSFSGREALLLARQAAAVTPFIYVSGTIGEERAVEALQTGATDYILKNNLKRLVPAVRRALQEAEAKAAHAETEAALRRTEEQLRQSQKLEAIGRLAGGVAHDFNNILTAILSYAALIRRRLPAGGPEAEDLEEIIRAADRAALLTRQLLAFSRRQALSPRIISLNSAVRDMEKMLLRLINENISLKTSLEPELWPVKADPGQLEQVLMNLCVNSRDAMPGGGELLIETSNVGADEAFAAARPPLKPGEYALLSVSDNGAGMDAATLARIYEPFFTTKGEGSGTGLGLSMVYGIVKQSGGVILAESAPGRGTRISIYLPRAVPEQQAERPAAPAVSSLYGTETVLIVEDDEAIRRLARRVLSHYGYKVLEAEGAEEALALPAAATAGVDLLLTDLVLPGISGQELARSLAARIRGVRTLFMSGYPDREAVCGGMAGMPCAFIQKPFDPDLLVRKVRELADAGR